jgi:hypothetical protein
MVSPIVIWGCMLLGGSVTLVLQQFVKPRLPIYKLQVMQFPTLQWIQGEILTRLTTDVQLHNDNYVQIDVHALSFDVFYSDYWSGELAHIGFVQDKNQVLMNANYVPTTTATKSTATATVPRKIKTTKRKKNLPSAVPLWQIQPRSNFSITDDLYLAPSLISMIRVLPNMILGLWNGGCGGTCLVVPTTGVAHIKASSQAPFTVSIVCDNMVDTWNMQILGFECALQQLHPGWLDLEESVAALRGHALSYLVQEESGGVLPPAAVAADNSWSKLVNVTKHSISRKLSSREKNANTISIPKASCLASSTVAS